jgi:hypothetical protein
MKKLISMLLLSIICFLLIGCAKEEPLTELEQYAVDCIEQYKSKIANPDELKIHDIRWRDGSKFFSEHWNMKEDNNSDVEGRIHIFLDKSYQNSIGGYTRDIGVCSITNEQLVYEGDYTENDNKTIQTGDKNWSAKQVAKAFYKDWLKVKEDNNSQISIDRVKKHID